MIDTEIKPKDIEMEDMEAKNSEVKRKESGIANSQKMNSQVNEQEHSMLSETFEINPFHQKNINGSNKNNTLFCRERR